MAESKKDNQKESNQASVVTPTGGGTGPVSGVSGMSPAERVAYIRQLQQTSPIGKITEAVKNLKLSDFGLGRAVYEQWLKLYNGVRHQYQAVHTKQKDMNQHISGLTAAVNGKEQLINEMEPQLNTELADLKKMRKDKGALVDIDWAPKSKGKVE